MKRRKARSKKSGRLGGRVFRFVWKSAAGLVLISLLAVGLGRFLPVPLTPLMAIRYLEAVSAGSKPRLSHQWVPLAEISPQLALAVVASEDQNFLRHHGFDFAAIKQAIEQSGNGGRTMRGASTISQQTAKNVFLWPQRSWLRKGLEVYFTVLIELFWSKKRILEVYLNSIEMGDGIYGAEAAARFYFKTSAAKLSKRQAAAIAAILPSPRSYQANPPSPYVLKRIEWISRQMGRIAPLPLR